MESVELPSVQRTPACLNDSALALPFRQPPRHGLTLRLWFRLLPRPDVRRVLSQGCIDPAPRFHVVRDGPLRTKAATPQEPPELALLLRWTFRSCLHHQAVEVVGGPPADLILVGHVGAGR